jgi:Protein of unknown function (DUF4239)
MSSMTTGWLVFACVFGGALLGMLLRKILPEDHLSGDSKDVIKLGTGLIGTMAALVLSLLISSAKGSHDIRSSEVAQMSANVTLLDRVLAHYGPEAREARDALRRSVARVIDQTWPARNAEPSQPMPNAGTEAVYDTIQALTPQNDAQRSLQAQALTISTGLAQTRWLLVSQDARSIPRPFLVVLVCWLAFIFGSFGLLAPPNRTVMLALFVCAFSFSSAIFLILELDEPFKGLIQISGAPLREALGRLGQ